MTQNGKRISWLFTVLLFHAAMPDRAMSSLTMTGTRETGEAALKSNAPPASWFQHWSINSGKSVTGEFATKPGAFKYSAVIDVEWVRCSGAVISTMWVLTSTNCFYIKSRGQPDAKQRDGNPEDGRGGIVQVEVETNASTLGWVYAGGIKYRETADLDVVGVQQQRLAKLLLYTETHTSKDLIQHDIMLGKVMAPGFRMNIFVQPIRFTNQRRFYTANPTTCIVVGFGGDSFETITMASLQQRCPYDDAADNVVCVNEYRFNDVGRQQGRSRNGCRRWPCMGDAGAPLVCRNMLIGTLRKEGLLPNDKCARGVEHTAHNFTFVGYYRDWIVEHAPVKFGVWRSGSPRGHASALLGSRGATYAAELLLDLWMYLYWQ